MAYTLHNELTDATLDDAFISYPNKRTALRVAKLLSKKPAFMVARIIVNDAEEMTVAQFPVPQTDRTLGLA